MGRLIYSWGDGASNRHEGRCEKPFVHLFLMLLVTYIHVRVRVRVGVRIGVRV